jgi:phospholipase/carboxylesterase
VTDKEFHEAPEGGVPYILRSGQRDDPLHIIMLHGWTGDERVMWVLETVLPASAPIVSLRGLFPVDNAGFQWTNRPASLQISMQDFSAALGAVQATLSDLVKRSAFNSERLVLMGFSQGAALSFALAEGLEDAPKGLISLAGFLPDGPTNRIARTPIFWGHGIRDNHVPIARAREDVRKLKSSGAKIQYCEADVGHKLGVECTRGLQTWLSELGDDR